MNFDTAIAHLESYIAGEDELGEVMAEDALEALDVVRKAQADARELVKTLKNLVDYLPSKEQRQNSLMIESDINLLNCKKEKWRLLEIARAALTKYAQYLAEPQGEVGR